MNVEQCVFLAEEQKLKIKPNFNSRLEIIWGTVELEAGVPVDVPMWLALYLKKTHRCQVIPPEWLCVDELKRMVAEENESETFTKVPEFYRETALALLEKARDDLEDSDQIKTLVADLWDRRAAKMRTSSLKFLEQHETAHAAVNNLTQIEIMYAKTQMQMPEAASFIDYLNDNLHAVNMPQ
ncbi:putative DNA replication complex GINS protein PSF2 [Aphelenchoides avenae]|nr:putative DNA replication complex GINS protein PSF2 [Aphelenchus avenae]KAH7727769.1 putative DNA replication complex GINS protein PSF2 [Aphelenchus avenae]